MEMEGKVVSSAEVAGRRLLNMVSETEGTMEDVRTPFHALIIMR
jgi:hypothetical protein